MSSPAVDVAVRIKVVDSGTDAAINKTTTATERAAQKAAEAAEKGAARARGANDQAAQSAQQAANTTATATDRAAQKAAEAAEKGAARQRAAHDKTAQAAAQAANKAVTATDKAAQKAADAADKSAARQRSSYERLAQAREALGVRPESAIQREIQRTEAAYNRLRSSGSMSWREQAVAADKMREKVTQLTNEMGRLTAAQKAYGGLKIAGAVVAGAGAAAYTLKGPAERAMSYDETLAHMANTAFSGERDAAGRMRGMKELETAINKARKYGGGTREGAARALDTMIASNAVEIDDAMKILPGVVKQAVAGNADPNDIALMAVRSMQTFGIKADDMERVMSGGQVAGQLGSFELKNMAKWLPEQMAMAKVIGISGKQGFAKLAAWNEAAAITAGTQDQGGNNVRDLLNEVNTPHFRKFMAEQYLANGKKLKRGDKERYEKNIDAVYLDYQNRGVDKVSATLDLMNKIFDRNPKLQAYRKEISTLGEKDPRRKEIVESMAAQVQGTQIGKVFHNQQSLMALLGIMLNPDVVNKVEKGITAQYTAPMDKLESTVSHTTVANTPGYKVEQAKEDAAAAQKVAMDNLTPTIGKVAEAFGDLAQKHPLLVGSTTLATGALAAFAGVTGLATAAMGGKGLAGGAITRASLAAAGGVALKAGKAGSIAGIGALVGDYALEGAFGKESAITRYGSSAINYGAIGAAVGSVVPVIGTGAGALVGAGTGLVWEGIKDLLNKTSESKPVDAKPESGDKPAEQKPVELNARMTVALAPGLVLQNQAMQAQGANVRMDTGNVFTGAP
ncbi:phage tail tape measure protein [Burkholderia metallica]|uniref:phage tail tape measure protein n=1 Tax=Burkholderia metallica TaxID=488729 RepID=UPI00157AD22E|nr:phage tail tape measure protein [Burkholderia metallica]NTZ82397.1 phage tail tape measure protein [Burkholderia metallica]